MIVPIAQSGETIDIVNNAQTFPDSAIILDYGVNPVAFLSVRGLMKGMENGDFASYNDIPREEQS